MKRTNENIRRAMGAAGVRQWQLAESLNISEWTLSRKLRAELSDEDKEKFLKAIKEMEAGT